MWKDLGTNTILEGEDFFLSFNPNAGENEVARLASLFFEAIGQPRRNGPETAIVILNAKVWGSGRRFLILMGDHRQALETALQRGGLPACLAYFREHIHAKSDWSDSLPEADNLKETLQ